MSLYALNTLESNILAFPITTEALNTVPTLALLLRCRRDVKICAISLTLRGNLIRHLHQAVPQLLYALETANPYPARQIDPGDTVTYEYAAGVIAISNADNIYRLKSKKNR